MMLQNFFKTLFIIFILRFSTYKCRIYISSESTCFESCLGDSAQPFNNLWAALQNNSHLDEELILLYNSTQNHFLQSTVLTPSNITIEYSKVVYISGNIKIRPLLCTESIADQFEGKCLPDSQSITLFYKDETIQFQIINKLELLNIQLNGIENINSLNSESDILTQIINSQIAVCDKTSSYSPTYPGIRCLPYTNLIINTADINRGVFILNSTSGIAHLILNNVEVVDMNLQETMSMVYISSDSYCNITNFKVENSYFEFGLFTEIDTLHLNQVNIDAWNLTMTRCNFYNFTSAISSTKGILFYFASETQTKFSLKNSKISDITIMSNNTLILCKFCKDSIFSTTNISNVYISNKDRKSSYLIYSVNSSLAIENLSLSSFTVTDSTVFYANYSIWTLDSLYLSSVILSSPISSSFIFKFENPISLNVNGLSLDSSTIGGSSLPTYIVWISGSIVIQLNKFILSKNTFNSQGFALSYNDSNALELSNLEISFNNFTSSSAKAIAVKNYLTLKNCLVLNNSILSGGTLIYMSNPILANFSDMFISRNYFKGISSSVDTGLINFGLDGGSFYLSNISINLNTFNTFTKFFNFKNSILLTVNSLRFESNTLTGSTSNTFLFTIGTNANVLFKECNFDSNNLTDSSKLINSGMTATINISNTSFSSNIVNSITFSSKLFETSSRSQLNFEDLSFSKNNLSSVVSTGFSYLFHALSGGTFYTKRLNLSSNKLNDYSSGFVVLASQGMLDTPYFYDNFIGSNLGYSQLVVMSNSNFTIRNFNISFNTVVNVTSIVGVTVNSIVYYFNGTFYNNTCDGLANRIPVAFYSTNRAIIYMSNISFTRNYQVQRGEFLSIKSDGYLYMNNSLIDYNHISSPSGSCRFLNFVRASDIGFDNITISDNFVENTGGFAYLMRLDTVTPVVNMKVNILRNYLTNYLSYIFYWSYISLNFYDSLFSWNIFKNESFASNLLTATFKCSRCLFFENIFESETGVTSFSGSPSSSVIEFEDSIFQANTFYQNTMMINIDSDDNEFIGTNLSFEGNFLYDSATLMKSSSEFNMNLSNISFKGNHLYNKSTLINTASLVQLDFLNLTFEENLLYDSSYILNIADSSLTGSNWTFTKNVRSEVSNNINVVNMYLNYISASIFSIQNVIHSSSPALFLIFTSTGTFQNLASYNITSLFNKRQFVNIFSSRIYFEKFSIESDPSILSMTDQWISATSSSLVFNDFNLTSLKAQRGFVLDLVLTDLIIRASQIIDTYFLDGTLFNSYKGYIIDISYMQLMNSGSLLSSTLVSNISINHVYLNSDTIKGRVISISEVDDVFFDNVAFYSKLSQTLIITSAISIQDIYNSLIISNSAFYNFRTTLGALYIYNPDYECSSNFHNLSFINNTAVGRLSGAISVFESGPSSYTFSDCLFDGNQAIIDLASGGKGGAIYLSTIQIGDGPTFKIYNSTFFNNYAESNGGAIYVHGVPPEIKETNFSNNKILSKENDIASQAIKIELVDDIPSRLLESETLTPNLSSTSNYSLIGIGSGETFKKDFVVYLLDLYGQIVIDDSYSTLSFITSTVQGLETSVSSIKASNGIYSTQDLEIIYQPGKSTLFNLETNGITKFNSLALEEDETSSISLSLSFRNCNYGEVLQPHGACLTCPEGYATFDFTLNSEIACQKCDANSMLCLGGQSVGPQQGYWRSSIYSDIFLQCKVEDACIGYEQNNTDPAPGRCLSPYKGNLCANCEDGYTMDSDTCILCADSNLKYFMIVLGVAFNLFILRSSVNSSIKEADEFHQSQQGESEEDDEDSGTVTKSLINYMQLSSLIASIKIAWPSVVGSSTTIGDKLAVSSPQLFSFKCLYPKDGLDGTYIDLLLTSLTPLMFFLAALLFWIVWFLIKKRKIFGNHQFKDDVLVTLIVICFNFQSPVLQANLQMFQCKNLYRNDAQKLFLQSNYDIECWAGSHSGWAMYFSVPMLMLWGLILPLLLFIRLRKNRKNLNDRIVILRYSFIFKGYKTSKYFWEFVIMLRKYLLIAISIFGSYSTIGFQIFAALYVMIVSFMIEVKSHPFLGEELNHLQISSIRSLAVFCFTALFFFFVENAPFLQLVFLVIWAGFSAEYLLSWLKKYLRGYLEALKKKINSNEKMRKKLTRFKRLSRMLNIKSEHQEEIKAKIESEGTSSNVNEKKKVDVNGMERFIKTEVCNKEDAVIQISALDSQMSDRKENNDQSVAELTINPVTKESKTIQGKTLSVNDATIIQDHESSQVNLLDNSIFKEKNNQTFDTISESPEKNASKIIFSGQNDLLVEDLSA